MEVEKSQKTQKKGNTEQGRDTKRKLTLRIAKAQNDECKDLKKFEDRSSMTGDGENEGGDGGDAGAHDRTLQSKI